MYFCPAINSKEEPDGNSMSFASVIFALVPPPVLAVSLSSKSVTFTEELTLLYTGGHYEPGGIVNL